MKKLRKKGFDYSHKESILHNTWKKGNYKGNRNYAQYQQYKRSLSNGDSNIDTDALIEQYIADGGKITVCPIKVA